MKRAAPAHGFDPERADIPRASYRLQFNRDFGFAAAQAVLPYLAELGISHVYASPFLKARSGSRHGYDIVDHRLLNPEVGSGEDFDRYCSELSRLGLGQVLDVVPNHAGVMCESNEWWQDVLENGTASAYADYFDIDWTPADAGLRGKVLLPVLAAPYRRVLEAGGLRLDFCPERGDFDVLYGEHRFPVDPGSYLFILSQDSPDRDPDGAARAALDGLLAALRRLPPRDTTDASALCERRRDKELIKRELAALCSMEPRVRAHVAIAVAALNGQEGRPESFDALDALIERQAWRLASWRMAANAINYRRFFDVNDLAALRMESDAVFEATHALIFRWLAEGRASGLRIDHPDGLADPARYFQRLHARHGAGVASGRAAARTLYLVVEKILGPAEALPADWPVHGSTGYGFAALCNQLLVDSAQEPRFTRTYRAFTGEWRDFGEVLLECKDLILDRSFPGELERLADQLHELARCRPDTRDLGRDRLRAATAHVVAAFPVYRSYIGPGGVSDSDRAHVEHAVHEAGSRQHSGGTDALCFLRDVLLSAPGEPDDALRRRKLEFARRFQQFTAPVMAKALEDTALYRYNRLVSINDVGCDPEIFGIHAGDFHAAIQRSAATHPFGLVASSTHDSKRSEDVRARIDVLSEIPGPWRLALGRWRKLNAVRKRQVNGGPAPSNNDEYLLYQTLLGVWPFVHPDEAGRAELAARISAFMLKAAREAKLHTSWTDPAPEYESALADFVEGLFDAEGNAEFLADFLSFQAPVARFGVFNSLAMLLLKLTVPGVPDIYQGCERWSFNLVDPDNRRPVDFDPPREQLATLRRTHPDGADPAALRAMLAAPADGLIKLYLLWRTLRLRKRFERTFRSGRYLPLEVRGPAARHVIAFAREQDGLRVITIVGRLLAGLTRGDPELVCAPRLWADTFVALPWQQDRWLDVISRRPAFAGPDRPGLEIARLFDALPLALLVHDGGSDG